MESKLDYSGVIKFKEQSNDEIKEDIKSINENNTTDKSIKSEISFKSDDSDEVSSDTKNNLSGEWNQIRLRASGTNIFNEIKENVSISPECLKPKSGTITDKGLYEVML